jgi:hypothetical protein
MTSMKAISSPRHQEGAQLALEKSRIFVVPNAKYLVRHNHPEEKEKRTYAAHR